MPEVSRFFGIIITMHYHDHTPPHFHVRYGEQKALLAIESLILLEGRLAPRVFGMVMEWTALHQAELLADWRLAQQQEPLNSIAPLE